VKKQFVYPFLVRGLVAVARLLGYEGDDAETLADALLADYDLHTQPSLKTLS